MEENKNTVKSSVRSSDRSDGVVLPQFRNVFLSLEYKLIQQE